MANNLLLATTLDFMDTVGNELASSLGVVLARAYLINEKGEANQDDLEYLEFWLRIICARFRLLRAYQYELKTMVQGEVKPDETDESVPALPAADRSPVPDLCADGDSRSGS